MGSLGSLEGYSKKRRKEEKQLVSWRAAAMELSISEHNKQVMHVHKFIRPISVFVSSLESFAELFLSVVTP